MENLEFFQTNNVNANSVQFSADNDVKNGDHFIIDDLLNFPNDDIMVVADGGGGEAAFTGSSTDSSTATVPVDTSCNSSSVVEPAYFQGPNIGGHFSNDLCVPYDDLADISDMEWLSNIVDDSFPSDDLPKLPQIHAMKVRTEPSHTHQYQFQPEPAPQGPILRPERPMPVPVPAKARSKRSRAAPGNWTSRLLVVSQTPDVPVPAVSSSECGAIKKLAKPPVQKKKEVPENSGGGEGRKCLHCATDKTPQWRTGPLGPKTLCNACGVRYKSGRLVPEYRPASSPTFVLTKHSNSHRKVLELRRQKEMVRSHQQQQFLTHHHHQSMMFDVSNGDDYLIHQHIGPDYRQLI